MTELTSVVLLSAVEELARRCPTATLVKNEVGNLAVVDGDEYVGYLDLRTGALELFADETGGATP